MHFVGRMRHERSTDSTTDTDEEGMVCVVLAKEWALT